MVMSDDIETVRRTTEKLRAWLRTDDDTMEGAEDCDTILAALGRIEEREDALADALRAVRQVYGDGLGMWEEIDKLLDNRAPKTAGGADASKQGAK